MVVPDPLNGEPFIRMPDTQLDELAPFEESAKIAPKSGLHNPLKNPERYCRTAVTKLVPVEFTASWAGDVMLFFFFHSGLTAGSVL